MKILTYLFIAAQIFCGCAQGQSDRYWVTSEIDKIDGHKVTSYYVSKNENYYYKVVFYAPPLAEQNFCSLFVSTDTTDFATYNYSLVSSHAFPKNCRILTKGVVVENSDDPYSRIFIRVTYLIKGKKVTEEFYLPFIQNRKEKTDMTMSVLFFLILRETRIKCNNLCIIL